MPQAGGGVLKAESEVRTLVKLPEGAIPIDVIEVCGFISAEGKRQWLTRFSGDAPVSTLLGLLTMAEHDIVAESNKWRDDEDST